MTTMVQSRHSCNRLSEPVVAVPALKGEEKTKTCRKATNPHSGEVFGDLNSSPHFPPLCQVRQKKKKKKKKKKGCMTTMVQS